VTAVRAGLLVFFFSVAAYASSLGNGFAYDDEKVVRENQVVTAGDWGERPTGALAGLAAAGTDQKLWDVVSESYVLKGDLPAAVRAREAAIGADPSSATEWDRFSEILAAMGNEDRAEVARAKAARLKGSSEDDPEQERGGRTP
jgi:hypothetical protein